jgi:hypothetical protein
MSAIPFHPLADIFPLMEGAEFEELVADIKANGQRHVIFMLDGMILDGRNRYRACIAAGVKPETVDAAGYSETIKDPLAYIISANIHRRHLTAEQKRDLIAKLVKAQPEKSDRAIGKMAKADGKTVAAVRAEQEGRAEIPHVEKRIDVKGRKQPAKKPPKVQPGTSPKRDIVKEAFDLVLQMNAREREKFFDLYLERYGDQKYRGKFTEAWREEESKAAPQPKRSKNKPKSPPAENTAAPPQRGEDNAPAPEVGAEIMKAKMAALDDGSDIPEFLRREPKAAAS